MPVNSKFNSYINVSNLDTLYRDFFSTASKDQSLEVKNRCFKELYNILESSVFKFYELFVDH